MLSYILQTLERLCWYLHTEKTHCTHDELLELDEEELDDDDELDEEDEDDELDDEELLEDELQLDEELLLDEDLRRDTCDFVSKFSGKMACTTCICL